ncbi:uncharacterized protein CIMG_03684 [Coccidioides immitis RS]|uniref:MARVEL domain-containing protein n=5 Tax=Coccidioides TaxID=5500 RepID=J3KBX2_COCIM|nr:uncharacterized protein CIMG_03684 [Coccidioides immitis RS]EFW20421.1 conserved hypothetical protein [Coccidioides posadasii str. Silveira]KMP07908.1 hypothetical protein CIRG_07589 [Coccidioides immitis RMSCC 2394]KMU85095.1 hypothetical protein CIHG_02877 [Coccidioides immitis H538.4]TPX19692.1 hypothetical protein DIZ76_017484 [Coccidioides immitis]EAS32660.3 hypothetical protein CIMG_03684 [Coccidioides immitis RS]
MAHSEYTATTAYTRKFHWPEIQLNIWILIVLTGSATCLGIFSWFMVVQAQMELVAPWVFPFMVAISALAIIFIGLILVLAFQAKLIPEIIILGSFVNFVLWLTGLIGTSIQLYGSIANVNSNCQNYVEAMEFRGASINTLAWLTQINICNCWKAAFSFQLVNTVFFIWMLFMALQVRRGES